MWTHRESKVILATFFVEFRPNLWYFVFVSRLYFVRFIILICCDKLYFPSPFLQSLLLLLVDPRFKLLEVCPISLVIAPVVKWTVIKALFSIKKPFGLFFKNCRLTSNPTTILQLLWVILLAIIRVEKAEIRNYQKRLNEFCWYWNVQESICFEKSNSMWTQYNLSLIQH